MPPSPAQDETRGTVVTPMLSLLQFLSQPHRNRLLFASFPCAEDSEVFDRLSVVAELPRGGGQDAGDDCSLGPPAGWDLPAT